MSAPLPSAVYLVAAAAAVVLGAAAASRWGRADALDRSLAGGIAGASIAIGAALGLGMAGALSARTYLASLAVVGLVAAAVLLRAGRPPNRAPAAWSLSGMGAVIAASALGFLALFPTLQGHRSQHVETGNYHITNLATWVRGHTIWELPFQNPGFFTATHPGNGELFSAAMLFATGSDQLAYVGNVFFGALCVLGCAMIARELDGRPDLAAVAALSLVGAPIVFATQAHSLATDLPATAGLVAGVGALLRARRTVDTRWVVAAGFALGLALGTKYTVLLVVPVVIALAVWGLRPRRSALWMAPGLALLAGPWFLRNLLATGNPIFPQQVSIRGAELLPGATSPLLELRTTILDHALAGNWDVLGLWSRIAGQLYGPAALLVVIGIVAGFFLLPRRKERLAVALVAAAAVGVYAITPYTGGGPDGIPFLLGSNIRYTMTFAFLGVALASVVMPSRALVVVSASAFGYDAWRMARGYGFRTDLDLRTAAVVVAAVALAALVAAFLVVVGRRKIAYGPATLAAGGATAVLVVAAGLAQLNGASLRMPALERVLSQTGRGEVMVLGVQDMRSVLGAELNPEIRSVSAGGRAGEEPPRSTQQLDAAVRGSDAEVLVVRDDTPGVPEGWVPPEGWTKAASTRTGDVYVKSPEPEGPDAPDAPDAEAPSPPAPDTPQPPRP